jgi:hypothetical protein
MDHIRPTRSFFSSSPRRRICEWKNKRPPDAAADLGLSARASPILRGSADHKNLFKSKTASHWRILFSYPGLAQKNRSDRMKGEIEASIEASKKIKNKMRE